MKDPAKEREMIRYRPKKKKRRIICPTRDWYQKSQNSIRSLILKIGKIFERIIFQTSILQAIREMQNNEPH